MPNPSDIFTQSLLGGGSSLGGDPGLNAFERTLGQNDYWKIGGASLLTAPLNTSTWDPMTSLGAVATKNFLGALLAGYGQADEANQINKVNEILPQLYANPGAVSAPDGVNSEAFAGLKASAIRDVFTHQQALDKIEAQSGARGLNQTLSDPLQEIKAKVESKMPLSFDEEKVLAGAPLGQQHLIQDIRKDQGISDRSGDSLDLRKKQLDDRQDRFAKNLTNKIEQESLTGPPVQKFQIADAAWNTLQKLEGQNTPAASISAIKAALKISNPTMGITDSQVELMLENPNNAPDQFRDFLSEIKGEGRLSPKRFSQLIESMRPWHDTLAEEADNFIAAKRGTFSNSGMNANLLAPIPHLGDEPTITIRNPKTGETKTISASEKSQYGL